MNFFYKIRHIPTGMYYQPVKGRSYEKTNLNKKNGKIYNSKPSLEHIRHGYNKLIPDPEGKRKNISKFFKFKKSEWEIVKFKIIEIGVE